MARLQSGLLSELWIGLVTGFHAKFFRLQLTPFLHFHHRFECLVASIR